MKNLVLIALAITLFFPSYSQYAERYDSPLSEKEPDIRIDAYFGAPDMLGAITGLFIDELRNELWNTGLNDIGINSSNIGILGLRLNKQLNNTVAIGGEFYLTNMDVGLSNAQTSEFLEVSFRRVRGILRFDFFYKNDGGDLELYGAVGGGFRSARLDYTTNIQNFDPDDLELGIKPIGLTFRLIPIGARYFFNPNIGLTTEIGLGGALINFGFSFRI